MTTDDRASAMKAFARTFDQFRKAYPAFDWSVYTERRFGMKHIHPFVLSSVELEEITTMMLDRINGTVSMNYPEGDGAA